MTCGDMCNPSACTSCPFKAEGIRMRRECKNEDCAGWLDYTDMGDLCKSCALPIHMQELNEEARLHSMNQKPEVLTTDLIDDQAEVEYLLGTSGKL